MEGSFLFVARALETVSDISKVLRVEYKTGVEMTLGDSDCNRFLVYSLVK